MFRHFPPRFLPLFLRLFRTRCAWAFLLAAAAAPLPAAVWGMGVSANEGLPLVTKGGGQAVGTLFSFWRANWGWADMPTRVKLEAPLTYRINGRNALLAFDLTARAQPAGERQMVWDFDLDAAETKSGVIGGGLSFKFDLTAFGEEMGRPELLPGNRGWSWGKADGDRIRMEFDPPLASVHFERANQWNQIRAFFYNGKVPAGRIRHTATLSIEGDGDVAAIPTALESFGPADTATWTAGILDWKTSPVDLSFLNATEIPAGKRGFVRTVGENLVFDDGTPARFWGTNLSAYTLFGTSRAGVQQQAKRLSQLGFNLVRIHHHDSPWVDPNIFGSAAQPNTQNLSAVSLDKLDWWIKCLRDEGIYVWLDLHVQRYLKPGDGIQYFSEIAKGKPSADLRGFNYVNASIKQAMKKFNEAYVGHLNPYTGKRYKDDPAIVGMLVTNENDLTHHFGNSLLPDKNVPQHNALYMGLARTFATTWSLSQELTWRSWEHGPAKVFLNDLERRFHSEAVAQLRSLGVKAPIATTSSWATMPLSSLPALTAGSVIDAHSYGGVGEIEKNPLYFPNLIHWIAAAQVAGKPLTVTEWNVEAFPAPDRHTAALYVAGSASLQGWDAVMQYAYAQVPLDAAGNASNWHAFNDPSMIATLPAAALLYRQGHVRQADTVYAFAPTAYQLFYQLISPSNAVALRTAAERGKLVIALPGIRSLPWLQSLSVPAGARAIANPNESLLPAGATAVTSDSGQLRRDWGQGIYTINTPRTQAATGWLGGRNIQLPDVAIAAATRHASVAVQSLDGNAIASSRSLMISLGARSLTGDGKRLPWYSEPVLGQLAIRAPAGLRLSKRMVGSPQEELLPFAYVDGRYVVKLDGSQKTYWLFLK